MRKGTKKNIIHGILIIFVIIFALMASLIAAFRDTTVQTIIARSLAGTLSKKLDTDVKIRTFYITTSLAVCIEDVQVNDLEGYPMFEIGRVNAKISPIMSLNDIHIKSIRLENVLGRLVKYEDNEALNINEIMSKLGLGKKDKDDENKEKLRLCIDNIKLNNGHLIFWNQHKDKPEKLGMDYAHLDVDSIFVKVTDIEMRNDSIFGVVHTLKGKDRCGVVLDNATGNVMFCDKCLDIENLKIDMNESHVDLDLRFDYENTKAYLSFIDSVNIIGNIRPSTVLLSDLRYFSWILDKMPDKFVISGLFNGKVSDFALTDFNASFGNITQIDADLSFDGLPHFYQTMIKADVRQIISSYDDLTHFAIPGESKTIPLPEVLSSLDYFTSSGSYQGYANDFKTDVKVFSDMGAIDADVMLNTTENSRYSFCITADSLNLKDYMGLTEIPKISFDLAMEGVGLDKKNTDFEADLNIRTVEVLGNIFKDILIHGDFENQRLMALTDYKHPFVGLRLASMLDLSGSQPSYNVIAKIKNADLVKLHLVDIDTVMLVSTSLDLAFSGNNIDNITGRLNIDSTGFYNGEYYTMDKFSANISEVSGIKDVSIDCDFFDFYGSGIIHPKSFANAIKNTAKNYINVPAWFGNTVPDTDKQEFSFSMNLKDTQQLSKLFVPGLLVSEGTTINATYTDGNSYHGSTVESPEVVFNGMKFKNIDIRNTAGFDEFVSRINIEDVILRDTTGGMTEPINLENMLLVARCGNDTVKAELIWDDDDTNDHDKAYIKSVFVPYEHYGGLLSIMSDEIMLNDTVWKLHPDCNLDFRKDKTLINKLQLNTGTQSMALDGCYPKRDIDTLTAVFTNMDVSDFDFITKGNKLDFDGVVNGVVGISGINENMAFSSNLEVDSLSINKQEVGDVFVKAEWHDPEKAIFINTEIYNEMFGSDQHESVGLTGYYYPMRKDENLSFTLNFDEFRMETVSPFISKVADRMSGYASGNVSITGSIKEPVVVGMAKMRDAGCRVNFLNTYYTFSDEVKLTKDKIIFEDMVLNDTLGNTALVNGVINHDYFKDFRFDINITCNDFLALDIPPEKAQGFYGTAIADGTVDISGPIEDITMDIDVLTKRGTQIDIPLSGTTTMDNDFIVFVKNTPESDTLNKKIVPDVVKDKNSLTMNLDAEVNSDAAVNIYLPMSMGNINARGNGNVNIGLDANDFQLRGDYFITSGTFNLTLEMVKRTFTLRRGGTIRWTGDPTDADIDVVGVYRTKPSLTSLGTTAVDSTALATNINVDCIIRLSDKLMNPVITFGMELPNAKEDMQNLVYSVIDTTNQAVMAQQVFSLLVLGSFASSGNNTPHFGSSSGYSVLTNQLSHWLSRLSKDFDIGINYTPNNELSNEELEVALSTQLFDERLTIEGNFGVIRGNKSDASNANNIVGDVDLTFRLTKRLSLKAYNHTNLKNNYYFYSFENYSDFTQGIGLSFSQSFDNIREIFTLNKRNKAKRPKMKKNDESKQQ